MTWSAKTDKKINELFKYEPKLRDKLLAHDPDTIRELGKNANSGFTSEEIIECYENNSIDYLYKMAKRKLELMDLYFELIGEKRSNSLTKKLKK